MFLRKQGVKEVRKKAELQREEAVRKRREEREKPEEKIEENRNADTNTDTVEISKEGKAFLKANPGTDAVGAETDVVKSDTGQL